MLPAEAWLKTTLAIESDKMDIARAWDVPAEKVVSGSNPLKKSDRSVRHTQAGTPQSFLTR